MRSSLLTAVLVMMAFGGLLAALTGVADAAAIERIELPGKASVSNGAAVWGAPLMLGLAVAGLAKKSANRASVIKRTTETDQAKRVLAILSGEDDEEIEAVRPRGPFIGDTGSAFAQHLSAVLSCLEPGAEIAIPLAGSDGRASDVDLPTGGVAMFNLGGTVEVYRFPDTELHVNPQTGQKTRVVKVVGDGKKTDTGTPKPAVVFALETALPHPIWNQRLLEIVQTGE